MLSQNGGEAWLRCDNCGGGAVRCHDCGCNTCALVPDDHRSADTPPPAGGGCLALTGGDREQPPPPPPGAGRRRVCVECGTPNDAAQVRPAAYQPRGNNQFATLALVKVRTKFEPSGWWEGRKRVTGVDM